METSFKGFFSDRSFICSYPTYEEWKQYFAHNLKIFSFVLILPMRNGNKSEMITQSLPPQCSYPTYEEWKLSNFNSSILSTRVLILPMRNGNIGWG